MCVRYADFSISDVAMQEELLESVDDSDSARSSMERLIAGGLSAVDAKRLFRISSSSDRSARRSRLRLSRAYGAIPNCSARKTNTGFPVVCFPDHLSVFSPDSHLPRMD
jgi:hypothetical protein